MARLGPRAPYACAASGPPVGHPCPYGPAPCRQALPPASLARLPVAKRRHRPLWPRRRRRRGGRPSGSAAAAGGRGGASFGWSSSRISCSSACSSPPGLPCAGDSAALAGKYPFFTFAHGAASAAELKCLLQPLTNVLPRGKVLVDAAALSSMQVVDGSKVMLIASQGLHQGDGPITKNTSGLAPSARRTSNVKEIQPKKPETIISKSRSERWKLTGVIALSDSSLKAVPEEVWDCGSSIRVLDVSNNCIEAIPHKIGALKSLNKLLLTANDIADGNICWEGLSCLQTLTVLSLNQNRLVTLPSSLGSLTFLRELRIANNRLDNIPVEIGLLKQLEILIASNNRIISLPSSIGKCESLTEVDLSSNLLAELPEAFGNLHNLKALHLRNNGLTSLPSTLFKKCWRLTTLDLHGTEITNDILRQVEGWEEFDERRRQKHQKQLDFRVGSSGVFDEGADDDNKRA